MANKEKLIEKAQKYIQKGKLKDALSAFEKVLQEDPSDMRIVLRKGEVEEKLDLLSQAAISYKQVAEKYSADGFYPKAVAIYKKITKIEPENMGIYMKLGSLYQKLGIDNEAKHYFNKVAAYYKAKGLKTEYLDVVKMINEFGGEDTGSKVDLAQEYIEQGDQQRAIEQFRAASQQIFESANIRELDMLVEKMAKLGIEDLDAQTIQVKTYMEAREPKKALRIIQKIYAANPKNTEILELLAVCFRELRQPSKALSVYTELEEVYSDDGLLDKAKRVQDAMQELQKKIKDAPPVARDEGQGSEDVFFEDQSTAASAHSSPTALLDNSSEEARLEASGDIGLDELEMFDVNEESESTLIPDNSPSEKMSDTVKPVNIDDLENELDNIELSEDVSVSSGSAKPVSAEIDASLASVDLSDLVMLDDISREESSQSFSGDVSELSFQSFEKPIKQSEISEEEVSGLIHKAGLSEELSAELGGLDAFDSTALDAEMMLSDDEAQAPKIDFDASPVGEIEAVESPGAAESQWSDQELGLDPTAESPDQLQGFESFSPTTPEKSEISVNEEEFIMIEEALQEPSLDEIDESPGDLSMDVSDSSEKETSYDKDAVETKSEHKSTDDLLDEPQKGPRIDLDLDLNLDEYEIEDESVYGADSGANPFDISDDDEFNLLGDVDSVQEESDIVSTPQELEAPPAPKINKNKTDLDSVAFDMEKSFPEVELNEDATLDVENMSESGFFDLSDALRDEIEEFENDDVPDDFEQQHLSPEEVILEFKKGIARTIDKSDSQTYYNLGVAYKEMGLLDEAIDAFETAQANDPHQIEAGSMIGLCKMEQGQYDQAQNIFSQLLTNVELDNQIKHGLMYDQALCLIELDQKEDAYQLMKQITDQDAKYRDALKHAQALAQELGIKTEDHTNYPGKMTVDLKNRNKQ